MRVFSSIFIGLNESPDKKVFEEEAEVSASGEMGGNKPFQRTFTGINVIPCCLSK